MEPTLSGLTTNDPQTFLGVGHGDAVIVQKTKSIHLQDIILYYNNRDHLLVLHRLIKFVNQTFFITKGDHNIFSDQDPRGLDLKPISINQVIGKVILILPYASFISLFILQILIIVLIIKKKEVQSNFDQEK